MTKAEFLAALVAKVEKRTFPDDVKQSAKQIAAQLTKDPDIFVAGELADNEDATIEEHAIEFGPSIDLGAFRDSGVKDEINEALRELGGRNGPVFVLDRYTLGDDDGGEAGIHLANLDGYTIAPNAFGEGSLQFVLSPQALKKGDLASAETVFSPGT